MEYSKIRKYHQWLRAGRTLRGKLDGVVKAARWLRRKLNWLFVALAWLGVKLHHVAGKMKWMRVLNPFRFIKKLDWYIIKKFIGTYFFAIALIISISIVFDVNENLAKFTQYHAPMKAIVFDYYANFVPYFANLFSPLFVFIAVIFFTSKLAGNSEIISMLAAGVSFKRLMRPYMISAALITVMTFLLGAYVIPKGTIVRQNFESMYKNKKLVSHMTASEIQYDTISDSKFHWKAMSWKIRKLQGLRENITSGGVMDTLIMMEPTDLVFSKGQQETFTSPELREYISKQVDRGSTNVVQYEVEYHKRIAMSFASFILTTIGLSLSSRKRKGGMGLYLGIGLALSFTYIMLQTVSATFAINAGTPPMLAAWVPNIIFIVVAYFCYRQAPN